MARFEVASLLVGMATVLAACGGARSNAGQETPAASTPSAVASPPTPLLPLSETPTLAPEPTLPFPIPEEYGEAFQLAGAVHGLDRLIWRIRIPTLSLESAVVPVGWKAGMDGLTEWDSPGPYVGWAMTSALPDESGNIVLYGHNNIEGSVFRDLYRLQIDDAILLVTGRGEWVYRVVEVAILAVAEMDVQGRLYEAYLSESATPRLTLISCYPPESNTHRVLVVARPAPAQGSEATDR